MVEIHDFWEVNGDPRPRLRAMLDLRDFVEDLPPTAQNFRRRDIYGDWHYKKFADEMLYMVGAWPLPDVYVEGDHKGQRWINPNYIDRHKYPEAYAKCECGAVLSRGYNDGGNSFEREHEHAEDCTPPQRLRARARMIERREEAILRGLHLGHSGRQLTEQVGIRAEGLGGIARDLGIDLREERRVFRRRAGRTYAEYRSRGIETDLLADAYDVHRRTIARWMENLTEAEYDSDRNEWEIPWMEDDNL